MSVFIEMKYAAFTLPFCLISVCVCAFLCHCNADLSVITVQDLDKTYLLVFQSGQCMLLQESPSLVYVHQTMQEFLFLMWVKFSGY